MTDYVITQGKVLSSAVGMKERVSRVGSGQHHSLKAFYFPDITYRYTVDGTEYENSQFWDEEIKIVQRDKIEPIVAQYPAGANVTVYYDPDNPSDAYLESLPEIALNRMLLIGVAALAALFVVAIVIVLIL